MNLKEFLVKLHAKVSAHEHDREQTEERIFNEMRGNNFIVIIAKDDDQHSQLLIRKSHISTNEAIAYLERAKLTIYLDSTPSK